MTVHVEKKVKIPLEPFKLKMPLEEMSSVPVSSFVKNCSTPLSNEAKKVERGRHAVITFFSRREHFLFCFDEFFFPDERKSKNVDKPSLSSLSLSLPLSPSLSLSLSNSLPLFLSLPLSNSLSLSLSL